MSSPSSRLFTHQASATAKTYTIMGIFLVVVIAVGYYLAQRYQNSAILYGFIGFSVVVNIISYWFSDKIAIRSSGALPADPALHREFFQITQDLTRRANLPMPKLYVIPDDVPNAFATGRNRDHSAVAVTQGLLNRLNRDEVSGVIAHELAHIGNKDILLMSVASIVAGLVAMVADVLGRNALMGDDDNRGALGFVAVMVSGILAQLGAAMIVAAVSRRREFLADETGALITGNPNGLASALRKISSYERPLEHAREATAHMYIANPFGAFSPSRLFASHPPMEDRVAKLEAMVV